jgi:hypothetical protein
MRVADARQHGAIGSSACLGSAFRARASWLATCSELAPAVTVNVNSDNKAMDMAICLYSVFISLPPNSAPHNTRCGIKLDKAIEP